jgi:hypothetical protein
MFVALVVVLAVVAAVGIYLVWKAKQFTASKAVVAAPVVVSPVEKPGKEHEPTGPGGRPL